MNIEEKNALRDKLIAVKNGAIKYDPLLTDIMLGRGSLAMQGKASLEVIEQAATAFADEAHKAAIDALRYELANDPDKVGYADQKPEVIQQLLMTQIPVYADVPVPPGVRDDADYLAAKIRAEAYVAPAPATVKVLVMIKSPPVGRIWQGIPYCRNMPSLDNIAEALE